MCKKISRGYVFLMIISLILLSCSNDNKENTTSSINWQEKEIKLPELDSLETGSSYLSVYSEIYERNQNETFSLTATISIRNISSTDSIYITRADYYDTHGNPIRSYLDKSIFLTPLETIEIVIDETDNHGGTGGNFIFDWAVEPESSEPLFEAIMISTHGQQGISFTTRGVKR